MLLCQNFDSQQQNSFVPVRFKMQNAHPHALLVFIKDSNPDLNPMF